MLGSALFLISTLLLARGLRGLPPARRCALATLLAAVVPAMVLCLAARLGLRFDLALVLASHAVLWAFALRRARGASDEDLGLLMAPFALALAAATLSALLGRNPAGDTLIDPWAHLAWSRDLPRALPMYPPGFPAFLRGMTLDQPLLGAFRGSAVVLHTTLACQFLALGATGGRIGPGALLALIYLIVPVSQGKFEPPRPETLAAVLVVASWWILLAPELTGRARRLGLGLATTCLLIVHVSALEIAHLIALGAAVLLGAANGSAGERWRVLGFLAGGGVLSLVISPWPWNALFAAEEIPLIAHQPGEVTALGLRSMLLLWGLDLVGIIAVSLGWIGLARKNVGSRTRVVVVALGLATVLLLLPIPLAGAGVHLPLQLITHRLVLAAALPLCMAATLILSHPSERPRAHRALMVGLGLFYLGYKLWRPGVPAAQLLAAGLATVVGIATLLGARRRPLLATGLALLTLATWGVRLWIWTPQEPSVVTWLREEADPTAPIVTNWPSTNELDALLSSRVLDGLAGRDASVGLHRESAPAALRKEISWCGEDAAKAATALATWLDSQGHHRAYVLVDSRFEATWNGYARGRTQAVDTGRPDALGFFEEPACPEPAAVRIERMLELFESDLRFEPVFGEGGIHVFRFGPL